MTTKQNRILDVLQLTSTIAPELTARNQAIEVLGNLKGKLREFEVEIGKSKGEQLELLRREDDFIARGASIDAITEAIFDLKAKDEHRSQTLERLKGKSIPVAVSALASANIKLASKVKSAIQSQKQLNEQKMSGLLKFAMDISDQWDTELAVLFSELGIERNLTAGTIGLALRATEDRCYQAVENGVLVSSKK